MESPPRSSGSERKRWRKILYEKQGYPDNYVDKAQFLNGLKKNCKQTIHSLLDQRSALNPSVVYTETYGLGEVILVSGLVTQELSRYPLSPSLPLNVNTLLPPLSSKCVSVCGCLLVGARELALSPLPPHPLSPPGHCGGSSTAGRLENKTRDISMGRYVTLSLSLSLRLSLTLSVFQR